MALLDALCPPAHVLYVKPPAQPRHTGGFQMDLDVIAKDE